MPAVDARAGSGKIYPAARSIQLRSFDLHRCEQRLVLGPVPAEFLAVPDYELAALSANNPALLEEVAEEQKAALAKEISELEKEAAELQEEIDILTDSSEAGIALPAAK